DVLEHVEAIHLRHLDVEKDQIGRQRVDGFDCVATIPALLEDLNLRIFLEQHTKIATRQRLVVDNQCSDLLSHQDEILHGITITTSTPPPSRLRISNWCLSSYNCCRRAAVLARPMPAL